MSFIISGLQDDPIYLRRFKYTFMKEKIWNAWCNVGFMPLTRKCLEHDKVRQEFGLNGASNEHHHNLKRLQDEYQEYKVKLKYQGYNSMDVMDLEIPVTEPTNIVEVREKQVEELVKQNGTVSSGRAFKIVGFTQVTSKVFTDSGWVAEERKQVAQEKKKKGEMCCFYQLI